MTYIYLNRYLIIKDKKYLLEWCEEHPFIQNVQTKEKTPIQMHSIYKFAWVKNKVKYTLEIDRTTRRKSEIKAFERGKYVEVEECECSLSTEKLE